MSKGKHDKPSNITIWWNKLMSSNILPIVWGALMVITITAALTSLGIVAVRWLLTLLGVIV